MQKTLFSKAAFYTTAVVKYLLFCLNLALLVLLGIKTVKIWTAKAFDFFETVKQFPNEPEFLDAAAAEKQLWFGLGFETVIFILGSFVCYEFLIKQKALRSNLIAPFVIAFLWLTGESINLFLPALDKVRVIETCQSAGITWNETNHSCNFMELEKKRMERFLAKRKAKKKAAAEAAKAAATAPVVTPVVEPVPAPAVVVPPAAPAPVVTPAPIPAEKQAGKKRGAPAPAKQVPVKAKKEQPAKPAKAVRKETVSKPAAVPVPAAKPVLAPAVSGGEIHQQKQAAEPVKKAAP